MSILIGITGRGKNLCTIHIKMHTTLLIAGRYTLFERDVQNGGKAHNVDVLSAEVERKEKSVGCQRAEIALSLCCATNTDGRGRVRSPCKSVRTMLLSYPHVSK